MKTTNNRCLIDLEIKLNRQNSQLIKSSHPNSQNFNSIQFNSNIIMKPNFLSAK